MARHRTAHGPDVPSDAEPSETVPSGPGSHDTEPAETEPHDTGTDEVTADDADASGTGADEHTDDGEDAAPAVERTAEADSFWADVRVDPVEIALPSGVGYTLRAYRGPDEVTPVEGDEPVAEENPEPAEALTAAGEARPGDAADLDESSDEEPGDEEPGDEEPGDEEPGDEEPEDEEPEEEPEGPDEVPVFLSRRGRLLLFHRPEALVEFLRSDEPHALRGLDSAEELADRIEAGYLVPTDEDRYELDLVVANLRGGHDSWEPDLLISAGELARDVAYALGLDAVQTSLSPGSPLDDLDEAMRAAAGGGFGGFRARRRIRKIGSQQAALAWRTIIGKISAAVDWRE